MNNNKDRYLIYLEAICQTITDNNIKKEFVDHYWKTCYDLPKYYSIAGHQIMRKNKFYGITIEIENCYIYFFSVLSKAVDILIEYIPEVNVMRNWIISVFYYSDAGPIPIVGEIYQSVNQIENKKEVSDKIEKLIQETLIQLQKRIKNDEINIIECNYNITLALLILIARFISNSFKSQGKPQIPPTFLNWQECIIEWASIYKYGSLCDRIIKLSQRKYWQAGLISIIGFLLILFSDVSMCAIQNKCVCVNHEFGIQLENEIKLLKLDNQSWINNTKCFGMYGECCAAISHCWGSRVFSDQFNTIKALKKIFNNSNNKKVWLDLWQKVPFNAKACRKEYINQCIVIEPFSSFGLEKLGIDFGIAILSCSDWCMRGWVAQEVSTPNKIFLLMMDGTLYDVTKHVQVGIFGYYDKTTTNSVKYDILTSRIWRYSEDIITTSEWWVTKKTLNEDMLETVLIKSAVIAKGNRQLPVKKDYCWLGRGYNCTEAIKVLAETRIIKGWLHLGKGWFILNNNDIIKLLEIQQKIKINKSSILKYSTVAELPKIDYFVTNSSWLVCSIGISKESIKAISITKVEIIEKYNMYKTMHALNSQYLLPIITNEIKIVNWIKEISNKECNNDYPSKLGGLLD